MINGGGVRINNKKVLDISTCIKSDDLIAGRMLLISMGRRTSSSYRLNRDAGKCTRKHTGSKTM